MTKTTFKRLLIIIMTLFITLTSTQTITSFAQSQYPFDKSNVLDDLESAEGFNLIEYPFDNTGLNSPKIVNFVEWCYTVVTTKQDDFALYVYFYNPEGLKIDVTSFSNKVQMATKYDSAVVTYDSKPTDYSTFPLVYCNKSERKNYEGLFYKFRVGFSERQKELLFSRLNSNGRRYDISGVTLATLDGSVKEYPVGGAWKFTGYAEGYGVNESASSTLKNEGCLPLETIELEVGSTTYRTSSSLGKGYENNITSVYFAVPDKYINNYGELQKIKAEWYEYKTQPMFVVNDYNVCTKFNDALGQTFTSYDSTLKYGLMFGFAGGYPPFGATTAFNAPSTIPYKVITGTAQGALNVQNKLNSIYYAFYNADLNADVLVTKVQIENYVKSYTSSYNNGKLPVKNGTISADLFQDSIDSSRVQLLQNPTEKRGYMVQEIDANDTFDILSYDSSHSGWEKFLDYGFAFNAVQTSDGRQDVKPIEQIEESLTLASANNFANIYLINSEDASDVKAFAKTAYTEGKIPYIFHFAQTEYYSERGDILRGATELYTDDGAVMATETVFLDYDIIQLTFGKQEDYTVIPVVQTPIDIFSDFTAPKDGAGADIFMAWFCAIVGGIVGLIMFALDLKTLSFTLRAGNLWVKLILTLLFLAFAVFVDYIYTKWIIDLVVGYGGLGLGVLIK